MVYVAVTQRQATLTQVFSYGIVYLHFYEIKLCFSIFGKNSKIQNGCHMWEEENFLKIAKGTLRVENFDEISLSRMVKEIESNLCFCIFSKYSKIQNGRHFWGE